jgi:hypothetical protein
MKSATPSSDIASGELKANIRHDIDPELVRCQIDEAIAKWERLKVRRTEGETQNLENYEAARASSKDGKAKGWVKPPAGPGWVGPHYDECIEQERAHYALVRIIELPTKEKKRFLLVYGDIDDSMVTSGTGPFESVDAAAKWFLESGR